MVGLYISLGSFRSCKNFTPKLIDLYKSLKEEGESFEIVLVSLDDDNESFEKEFMNMPWLAIPFGDTALKGLPTYFSLNAIPTVVILGPDAKTLHLNVRSYIAEFGIQGYPFTEEKLRELEEFKNAQRDSQTLESLLISDELDFVIGKGSANVSVSELVGKTVLFYFSRLHCPPCRVFTPKLAKIYNAIKSNHSDFEVIFVSLDNDEESFHEYYSEMPWLALPYNDKREALLTQTFKSSGIPHLSAVGPSGKTLTNQAKDLVVFFGSDAYPFSNDKKKEMDRRLEEMAKGWPEKVRNERHPYHELVLSVRGVYSCDGCNELVVGWVFSCDVCGFHLHPECALMPQSTASTTDYNEKQQVKLDDDNGGNSGNESWICDGEVCYKTS